MLSPHRDDAAFSLYHLLCRLCAAGAKVTVINFFTRSSFSPWGTAEGEAAITEARAREDRRALRMIGRDVRQVDLGWLDAPLRLEIPASRVLRLTSEEIAAAPAVTIRSGPKRAITLAPLGLGNHVDHRLVHTAAVSKVSAHRLGFYEDLPYVTRDSEEDVRRRISETEDILRLELMPMIVPSGRSFIEKRAAAAAYRSQVTAAEADAIARWGNRYRGAERVWISRRARARILALLRQPAKEPR